MHLKAVFRNTLVSHKKGNLCSFNNRANAYFLTNRQRDGNCFGLNNF